LACPRAPATLIRTLLVDGKHRYGVVRDFSFPRVRIPAWTPNLGVGWRPDYRNHARHVSSGLRSGCFDDNSAGATDCVLQYQRTLGRNERNGTKAHTPAAGHSPGDQYLAVRRFAYRVSAMERSALEAATGLLLCGWFFPFGQCIHARETRGHGQSGVGGRHL